MLWVFRAQLQCAISDINLLLLFFSSRYSCTMWCYKVGNQLSLVRYQEQNSYNEMEFCPSTFVLLRAMWYPWSAQPGAFYGGSKTLENHCYGTGRQHQQPRVTLGHFPAIWEQTPNLHRCVLLCRQDYTQSYCNNPRITVSWASLTLWLSVL